MPYIGLTDEQALQFHKLPSLQSHQRHENNIPMRYTVRKWAVAVKNYESGSLTIARLEHCGATL